MLVRRYEQAAGVLLVMEFNTLCNIIMMEDREIAFLA